MRGPLYNQDSTEFFYTHAPEQICGEAVDAWVDRLAQAGVGTLLSNVNAMRTNYASEVWEPDWFGYDPNGPNDQPVLRYLPPDEIPGTRRRLDSAKRLADMGINFHQRAFARCREHGIGAWVSVRMNDVHDCHLPDSPLLSTFYKREREAGHCRVPHRMVSWQDRALDWERPAVQEHYMKLVVELLTSLDLDGIELDWMRFGYHFQIGRELIGGKALTEWIGAVRQECARAEQRLGHPVALGVRVPSNPVTARALGLDGVSWAHQGLVDLVVPTPFWETCEFDMPIATWKRLLEGTGVVLAGGLEIRYQPYQGGPAAMMSPELARGAAVAVLAGGADHVYLFNYFADMHLGGQWTREQYEETVGAMGSLAALNRLSRHHGVTFRDIRAPGEPRDHALPASGSLCAFRLQTGPDLTGRAVEVLLERQPPGDEAPPAPAVHVNSVPCALARSEGRGVFIYTVAPEALTEEAHVVEVESVDGQPMTILRVEIRVGA